MGMADKVAYMYYVVVIAELSEFFGLVATLIFSYY